MKNYSCPCCGKKDSLLAENQTATSAKYLDYLAAKHKYEE